MSYNTPPNIDTPVASAQSAHEQAEQEPAVVAPERSEPDPWEELREEIRASFVPLWHGLGQEAPDWRPASAPDRISSQEFSRPLEEVLAAATDLSASFATAPEWRQILALDAAFHAGAQRTSASGDQVHPPGTAINDLPGAEATAMARGLSSAAWNLATQVRQDSGAQAPAYQALWRLHRTAADYADQLAGHLPPDRTLDHIKDLRKTITEIRRQGTGPVLTGIRNGSAQATIQQDVEHLFDAWRGVSRLSKAVTNSDTWKTMRSLWREVSRLAFRAHEGVLRWENDAQTYGAFTAVWLRTCEVISGGAQSLVEQLARGGHQGSRDSRLLGQLHQAADQAIRNIRGTPSFAPSDAAGPEAAADREPVLSSPAAPSAQAQPAAPASVPDQRGAEQRPSRDRVETAGRGLPFELSWRIQPAANRPAQDPAPSGPPRQPQEAEVVR